MKIQHKTCKTFALLGFLGLTFLAQTLSGAIAYPDPPGGWTYIYNGDKDAFAGAGAGFASLDGTWSADNGSAQWAGDKIGGTLGPDNPPGGVMSTTEGGVTFLRVQDTGNPTGYGYADPSDRKLYFGHDATADGASATMLDDGVTLTFRARIPTPKKTSAPLDQLYEDGQAAAGPLPYPDTGDGYVISDGGKGNFVAAEATGGSIAFAFTVTNDVFDGNLSGTKANFAGLTMNKLNGNQQTSAVQFDSPGTFLGVPFDPTDWHELWIVLRKDPSNVGTHQAFIFLDGSKDPAVFSVTAGSGNDDYSNISYLGMGGSRTAESFAIDIDFFGYRTNAVFPAGALTKPYLSSFSGSPNGFTLVLSDGLAAGATKVNSATLTVTMNGQTISPKVSVTNGLTTINYTSPSLLLSGSSNLVAVAFADTGTPPATQTIQQTFVVPTFPTIAAATALDDTKLDRNKKGFTVRPYGTEDNNPDTIAWTEDALAGKHGANTADLSGAAANGTYAVTGVINFDIATGHGDFTDANGHPDSPFPGFPGSQSLDGGTGNAIEEILCLVEFPSAGYYSMGVNSDDGFRLTSAGPDPRPPANTLMLGQYDGGRSAADTIFGFGVEAPGVYAFRLVYENGNGDASLEWFSVQPDGTKVLVNDTTAGALKAYQFQTLTLKPVTTPPKITSIQRNANQVVVQWTGGGTLQSADLVTGPWSDISGSSPNTQPLTGAQKFYRVKL